jgi:hypothetical protein
MWSLSPSQAKLLEGAAVTADERERIVVPFPEPRHAIKLATHCRSTVLLASLHALMQNGWFEGYKSAVAPEVLEAIQGAVAGAWLPMHIAAAHYRACDSLGISVLQQLEIGGAVVRRLQQTLLGTLAKVARASGTVSPLTALSRFKTLHARSWIGSAGQVVEIGPKDVRLDVVGLPLVEIPYFRTSYRGFLRAGAQLFADHAFVTEISRGREENTVSYRFAWV